MCARRLTGVTAEWHSACGTAPSVTSGEQPGCVCNDHDPSTWNREPAQACCAATGICGCCRATCPSLRLSTGETGGVAHITDASACAGSAMPCPTACHYPLDAFRTADDIQAYANTFGMDRGWAAELMPTWCAQRASDPADCPIDPATGTRYTACSRFLSRGPDGVLCQQWARANPQRADPARLTYCADNRTPDCACINPQAGTPPAASVYAAVAPALSFAPPGCWWAPCSQPEAFVVPETNPAFHPTSCPSAVCEDVQRAITAAHLNPAEARPWLYCPGAPPLPPLAGSF